MKNHISFKLFLLLSIMLQASYSIGETVVVCHDDFEGGVSTTKALETGFQNGASVEVSSVSVDNYAGSKGSLRGVYPKNATGSVYIWSACRLSELNASEVYVEFKAKLPKVKHGFKFLKIFGQRDVGYANTTFGLDYTRGVMDQVSFGDGSDTSNDTAHVINLDGSDPQMIGRSYGVANVLTPQQKIFSTTDWDDGWHHFRFKVKFNSGTDSSTEMADGEFYVEIDGNVYVDAKNIFNRHPSNSPIDSVSFFGWTQQTSNEAFEVWYDEIIVSTGGFTSASEKSGPMPPSRLEGNLSF